MTSGKCWKERAVLRLRFPSALSRDNLSLKLRYQIQQADWDTLIKKIEQKR